MSFDMIALAVLITGWMACGVVPWLLLSVFTRGNAGLIYLPLCMLVAVVAALVVPILGLTNFTGLWLSFVVALVAPAGFLAIRRYSLSADPRHRAADVHSHASNSAE